MDAQGLLKTPPALILMYGNDEGLIQALVDEISDALEEAGCPFKRLPESGFLENPEAHLAPDLFSDPDAHSFYLISEFSEKNAKTYLALLERVGKNTLIVTSLKLRTTSALVQASLKSPRIWGIPAYPLEGGALLAYFQKRARAKGLTFLPDALKMIGQRFKIEETSQLLLKLKLLQGPTPLTADDVADALPPHANLNESLAYALSGRNSLQAYEWLTNGGEPLLDLRGALRHFMALLQVRASLDEGASLETALGLLDAPIFFKHLPLFKAHVRLWSSGQLMDAISHLALAELSCKKGTLSSADIEPVLIKKVETS